MERSTFFRPSDDMDFMAPLSDVSDDEVFASAPRMAARSMALAAKKRGLVTPKQCPELGKKPNGRQLWADVTTDDEDNFPSWRPGTVKPLATPSPMKSDGSLVWDPIGLGTSESSVAGLLYNKTAKTQTGSGTVFDKWSWSTAATDSADSSQVEELQTDDEDLSPKATQAAGAQQVIQIPQPSQTQAPQLPAFQLQIPQAQPLQSQQVAQPMAMMPVQQMQQVMGQGVPQQIPQQIPQQMPQAIPQGIQGMPVMPGMPQQMQPGMLLAVPYSMPIGMGMLPMVMSTTARQGPQGAQGTQGANGASQLMPWKDQAVENARQGPPMGTAHRFHQKNSNMGVLSSDARTFTKKYNKGRLSIVSENKVHFQGNVRYALQFTEGELCSADGVGFILSSDLPCTRNIQKIISVFANRTGRICIRVHDEVVRCSQRVKELDVGDWLEVNADLVDQSVSFTVWPRDNSSPSFATVSFKEVLENARGRVNGVPRNPCGFLAVVIKHVGVSVKLAS
eukprot:symbB.v1.2.024393.t1/scaffold2269.1/size83792/5